MFLRRFAVASCETYRPRLAEESCLCQGAKIHSPLGPDFPKMCLLAQIDGFISIERFESLSRAGTLLSLSFWRDEDAVQEWRRLEAHRAAQAEGRAGVFADYRLRVASVLRDYGMEARDAAPKDSRKQHDQPTTGCAKTPFQL